LKPAIQAALVIVIRGRIQDKLNVTFRPEPTAAEVAATAAQEVADAAAASDVVTTDEEIQAFMIIRAISAHVIDVERVTMWDAKSYCSIFVDDNNRKPVCRYYFNAKNTKSVGVFDDQKVETKLVIERLADICNLAKQSKSKIRSRLLFDDLVGWVRPQPKP
jgi:predicted type IV restriction endonuclease